MKKAAEKIDEILEIGGIKKQIIFLVISGISLVLSITGASPLPFDISWTAIILCGVPIIIEAVLGLVTELDITADLLVAIALVASVIIGETFAAGEIAVIMQTGELLEELTVKKARSGIEKLTRLTPQTARIIQHGKEIILPAEKVAVNDVLRVLPGETIPADGVIISGKTSVDQAVMTGESMPIDKEEGDTVLSGTVNRYGAFEMRALKVGKDSSIERMIRLVRSADASKAKIVSIADRWAAWIVVAALAAAGLTWIFSGELIRAVTILVVFCPCALVLATPTAIMAAIGNAAKHSMLVKEGDALERLSRVTKITFDKTGTLTKGEPRVAEVKSALPGISDEYLYNLTASAENMSEHPLGRAIVSCYKDEYGKELLPASDFRIIPGEGAEAKADGKNIAAGNKKLMDRIGITIPDNLGIKEGLTLIYIAVDGRFAGYTALSDTVREESFPAVKDLDSAGIDTVLLTGDNYNAASAIAKKLGIKEVIAGCLPEDKLDYITKREDAGEKVCMVGDGINDAPSLKKAHVGIAMGGIGSDIAVDSADIALVNDRIDELPHLFSLSRRMMTTIKLNIIFSLSLNFIATILAIAAVLDPVAGALIHNAGAIAVIANSALLLRWKKRKV